MTVYVNDMPVHIIRAMSVRHALLAAGLLKQIGAGRKVYDEWGNELGLDGALTDQARIYIR
ncbi:MAG: hypothetical protein ACYC69_11050 [Thermodesulfovibrionales bacterium]